jgi:hypothetical protein
VTEKPVKGRIDNQWDKPIVPALTYSGMAKQFATIEEVKLAGAWPNEKSILKMVNAKEVAKKRAELIKAALDAAGIKAPTLEDDSEAIKATAKVLMARKKAETQEEAEAMAREILGIGADDTEDESEEVSE